MFALPQDFAQFMLEVHGTEKAMDWFTRLPEMLADCAQRWRLKIYPPLEQLSFHYIAPAERADGTPVILKINSPTHEFAQSVEALRLFSGPGMVRLLEVDDEYEAVLLERLLPGSTLAQLVPEKDEQATSVLASVMRQLWRSVPVEHTFPTVEDWGKGLLRLREHYAGGYGPFPPRLVNKATALFTELSVPSGTPMLLHGDLHHENVLRSEQEWCAIDPKGVVGDPGYEVGAIFYNPLPLVFTLPDLPKILARRVDQLAEELEMERERIRGWGLAQCVLSSWWSVEDNQKLPYGVLACAEILSNLK
jgi:streptomycin 6-kinase